VRAGGGSGLCDAVKPRATPMGRRKVPEPRVAVLGNVFPEGTAGKRTAGTLAG
jgi:hypothetical protein